MKKIIPVLLACFLSSVLFAQDVRLNDSIIFIKEKPIAVYAKWLSNSPLRYNMEVYSFTDYVLIKAEVIKFNAPVSELKPFYYYELTFPPTADTFYIYIEDEALPLVMAKIINTYNLINNNELNKKNLKRFIAEYHGGPALTAKINSIEDFLDETRNYKEQVIRDRLKPVVILKSRTIIQDGVVIGTISALEPNIPLISPEQQIRFVPSNSTVSGKTADGYDILLPNQRPANRYRNMFSPPIRNGDIGFTLYKLSLPEKMVNGSVEDLILQRICFLIEEYAL